MEANSNGYIYKAFLYLRLKCRLQKKVWKACKSQKIRGFAVRLCFLLASQDISVKSHQHHCPHMISTRPVPTNILNWMGKNIKELLVME